MIRVIVKKNYFQVKSQRGGGGGPGGSGYDYVILLSRGAFSFTNSLAQIFT